MKHVMRRLLLPVVLLPVAACGGGNSAAAQAGAAAVPLYDNLGNHHYEVTTAEPLAQRYFDQGLRLYYAFNHAEAIRAFEEAARLDPRCAMCVWGIALAYGPNINLPMDSAAAVAAYASVQQANELREHASPKERALIDALSVRYTAVPSSDRAGLDSLYARAMGEVAARFPGDPEVATLYAEALMALSPWQYWERDGSPRPDTPELLAQLEAVLATQPDHPGANHFFIHAVEAVDPQRAVPMAERLAGLMPGAGHLVHMPGHIYVRVGRYIDAIRANEHAVHADESWIRDHNPGPGIYTVGYYPHNYDFLAFAASMIGRSRQALDAADRMVELIPDEMLRAPGMTLLQNGLSRGLQMRVRFGRWDEILATLEPAPDLPYARGIWHYAQGRALAATGNVAGADRQLALLRAAAADPALRDAYLEFNPATALLAIAGDVLAAYTAAARLDMAGAVAALRAAVALEDELVYGEPPEWSIPVRQDLGAMLLAAGRAAEAEAVFREDLQRFPENGWSLHGLARSLEARGLDREAAAVQRRFIESWSSADVEINRH
jgi:tetratricopeptide (TPR) repeat protein